MNITGDLYNYYATAACNNAKRINKAEGVTYTESQCQQCPYKHACCDYFVGVTPFEAVAIIEYIRTLPNTDEIFKKIETIARVMKNFFSQYSSFVDGERAWGNLKKKCVFYDQDKKQCSIFKVRPMNCRLFFSTRDCSKQEGQILKEDKQIVQDRFQYMFSPALEGTQIYELCATITQIRKQSEIRVDNNIKMFAVDIT